MVLINDLPDEVLEFIFGHLPPYKDLEECSLVCKRWNRIVHNVIRHTTINLDKSLAEFKLCWKCIVPIDMAPMIAGRFSHAAAVHENSMYIFGGGSSSSTTFNDLWRFDLSKRQWIRPLSMGTYPSPKACATMVCYKNTLILFGGWRYPSAYPPYQPWRLFDELHVYNIKENRWSMHTADNGPPPTTGHSATIHRNKMIVFGGFQRKDIDITNSNIVWCLDLDQFTWSKPQVSKTKPPPRCGQYQIYIDDNNCLIMGGCGGPNNMFNDAWLLNMCGSVWEWKQVYIQNKQWTSTHMWCNPACRVGTKLVILGPTPTMPSDFQYNRQHMPICNSNRRLRPNELIHPPIPGNNRGNPTIEEANRRLHEEPNRPINRENINLNAAPIEESVPINDEVIRRRRNLLRRQRQEDSYLPKRFHERELERLAMAAFNIEIQDPMTSQERRLELLRKMEEKYSNVRRYSIEKREERSEDPPSPKRIKRNLIALFVCDIVNVLKDEPSLNWVQYKNFGILAGAPERLIHSSIVAGNGELIMFGGLRKETISKDPLASNSTSMQVSNAIHFLTFPRSVI